MEQYTENPGTAQSAGVSRDMAKSDLLSVVQRELDSAQGWTGTLISEARRRNLGEYFGNRRGDEREGRSQVTTRDTFEQVEWLLPPLMEIFTSSNEICRFIGTGPEDEEAAAQATDAVNHVFQQNDGFMVLYTMFKDALIQKNGVVKVFWEEDTKSKLERYQGKPWVEVMALVEDPTLDIRAMSIADGPELDLEEALALPPEQLMGLFFDVEAVRINRTGKVCLENIPPEEFVINRDARGLNHPTCRFVGHRIRTSESQLVAWGYDESLVKRLPGSQSVTTTDQDAIVRSSQDDSHPLVYSYRNDSERTIYVTECYVLLDADGDGVSEWWKVLVGGDYGQALIDAEQVDGHPFCSVTPIPVPHRFFGLGLADVMSDLQNINTTLTRQFLDSLYLSNDPMNVVLSEGTGESAVPMVNLDQLVQSGPGRYVEEYVQGALRPYETRDAGPHVLPAFEHFNGAKERRTGISPDAMGISADAISKHVYGAMVQQSGAAQRVTLYARIFADTGVKDMFELIYKCLLQNPSQGMMVRLRGEWVPVDPSSWNDSWDCKVSVGLGHGSRMEKAGNIQSVGEIQRVLLEAGYVNMVSPDNLYHTAVTATEMLGFKNVEAFFTDPATVPPPEPEPDVAEQAVQAQQQIELMKVELDRQKLEIDRDRIQLEAKKVELAHEAKVFELRMQGAQAEMDSDELTVGADAA